jgi:hypothetical protein
LQKNAQLTCAHKTNKYYVISNLLQHLPQWEK